MFSFSLVHSGVSTLATRTSSELRELDVVEHAPTEESVRQLLLRIGGDDDDGALPGLYGLLRLGDVELHPVQLPEKVVGKFQIRLVDLVD